MTDLTPPDRDTIPKPYNAAPGSESRDAGLVFKQAGTIGVQPLDYGRIEAAAAARPGGWLWAIHCETSTGALADLSRLKSDLPSAWLATGTGLHQQPGGATPVDLRGVGVWLASAASGKGLAAYPGLGLVFCAEQPQPDQALPSTWIWACTAPALKPAPSP